MDFPRSEFFFGMVTIVFVLSLMFSFLGPKHEDLEVISAFLLWFSSSLFFLQLLSLLEFL